MRLFCQYHVEIDQIVRYIFDILRFCYVTHLQNKKILNHVRFCELTYEACLVFSHTRFQQRTKALQNSSTSVNKYIKSNLVFQKKHSRVSAIINLGDISEQDRYETKKYFLEMITRLN